MTRSVPAGLLLLAVLLPACDTQEGEPLSFGFLQQPIVGGQLETGYPAVGVVFKNSWGGGSMCTATLISPKVVLTAAHCAGYGAPNSFFVGNNLDGYGQIYDLSHFIPHPNYQTVNENYAQIGHHDIAVGVLKNAAATAPMPYFTQSLNGYQGTAVKFVGFGVTSYTAGNSGTKRSVSSSIGEVWSQGWWNFTNPSNPKNTCQGDSGGPAFMTVNGVETVVGVVSSGDPYCTESGYNTRTDTNASWIAQMISTYDPTGTTAECGNGICEVGETTASCPADCQESPAGGFWDACGSSADCENGMVCVEADGGGRCTLFCSSVGSAAGCPEGSVCVGLQNPRPGQEGVCYVTGSQCGDGACTAGETAAGCPQDCGGGGACGNITYEGCCDGAVLTWCEDGALKTLDCAGNPSCGWQSDAGFYNCGTAGAGDPSGNYPKACGAAGPVCGDGACDTGETATGCPADCAGAGPVCGDGACDPGETTAGCPADCAAGGPVCGDGACDTGETGSSCPADCGRAPAACEGGVTEIGCCEGQKLVFCDGGELKVANCETYLACGWDAGVGAYSCGTDGTADPSGIHPMSCSDVASGACGDGTCAADEGCGECPQDCGPCGGGDEDVTEGDTLGGLIEDALGGKGGGCVAAPAAGSPWGLLLLVLGMFLGTRLRIQS